MATPEPRALLEESAWLHRLARRLVSDPTHAEDVAQATLVAALEQPPAVAVPFRRWLAGVLRNIVRQDRRGAARRVARERERSLELEDEPTDVLAARLELQERLVARVRALPEPYRTTIALRFLDDLSTREVAARMGVPEKTVHTRIERALARLRDELDREHGSREAWAALLLPFVAAPGPTPDSLVTAPTSLLPLLAMGTLSKWAGAAAALALLGWVVIRERAEPRAVESAPGEHSLADATLAASRAPEDPIVQAREELAATAMSSTPAKPALALEPPVPSVSGRVVDVEQRGIPGLEVFFQPTSHIDAPPEVLAQLPRTASGAGGVFELPLPDERGRLVAAGQGYATLLAPGLTGGMPPEPPRVVVAPAHRYGGIVVDAEGRPVPEVELEARLIGPHAEELLNGLPAEMQTAVPLARLQTGADGAFLLEDVPFVEGVALVSELGGFERLRHPLPPFDDLDLCVVLGTPAAGEPTLSGFVRFADGRPARGAWVSAGEIATRALADGSFTLVCGPTEEPESLCAAYTEHLPARVSLAEVPAAARQSIELELGGPALTIEGTVVDGAGNLLRGAQVWARGGERFGAINQRIGEADFLVSVDVEQVLTHRGERWDPTDGRKSVSGENGRFRLRGLLEREYDVLAMHPVTQEIQWLASVPAGTRDLRLVLEGAEPTREVRGRVVTLAGEPVAGAQVGVSRDLELPDGSRAFKGADFHAVTDARGEFRFEALCIEGTSLVLSGEVIATPAAHPLEQEPDLSNVVLRAPARCHLRVILADPARADSLTLLDEHERTLSLDIMLGSVTLGGELVVFQSGTSPLIGTDESARFLELTKGEQRERIPIRLTPGEVNELRL